VFWICIVTGGMAPHYKKTRNVNFFSAEDDHRGFCCVIYALPAVLN